MKKIISLLSPVSYTQTIIVYEDGNRIDLIETNVESFYEDIYKTIEKYDIEEIRLLGAKKYINNIKEKLEKETLTKFTNNIEILI